jgi:hypothetical protein
MLERLLQYSATVEQPTTSQGANGEVTSTYAASGTYKTRVSQVKTGAEVNGTYQRIENAYVFYFLDGTPITAQDRILYDDEHYQVVQVKKALGRKAVHHLEVLTTRVLHG